MVVAVIDALHTCGAAGCLRARWLSGGALTNETVTLHNKEPRWNESLGAYCLNFNGR